MYRVTLFTARAIDYGKIDVFVNGKRLGKSLDLYAPLIMASGKIDLGRCTLEGGLVKVGIEATKTASRFNRECIGLDAISFVSEPESSDGQISDGIQGAVLPSTQPQKLRVDLTPSNFLGQTLGVCENRLGKPALVEGFGVAGSISEQQIRYYKIPGVTRLVLLIKVNKRTKKLFPEIYSVRYDFTAGTAKTWQEAFKVVNLSTQSTKATLQKSNPKAYDLNNVPGGYSTVWAPSTSHNKENSLLLIKP